MTKEVGLACREGKPRHCKTMGSSGKPDGGPGASDHRVALKQLHEHLTTH